MYFPDGFKPLVIRGKDSFMFMDPRPPEQSPTQQMIRGSNIYDMKSSYYSDGPNNQVEVDVAKKDGLPPKPYTSIGCTTILSREIPIASSIDKGIMFSKELGSIRARLNSTSRT